MKKTLLVTLVCLSAYAAQAQVWNLSITSGLGISRLIPSAGSTHGGGVSYGFQKPGIWLSPEIALAVNDHSSFSLGYQYAENNAGISFKPAGAKHPTDYEYDEIDLHTLSVGYHFHTLIFHQFIQVGYFATMGLAYGYMSAMGGGGTSGDGSGGVVSSGTSRISGFEVIPTFWTPTSAVGFMIGTNARNHKIADRLSFTASANICWKDPYTSYSKVQYSSATTQYAQTSNAQYKGAPLSIQMGVSYRLKQFGKAN